MTVHCVVLIKNKSGNLVLQEILELCEFIYLNSCEDDDQRSIMLFGDLFKLYTRISDKVVGKYVN